MAVMNVFRRKPTPADPPAPRGPSFGEWLLRQFSAGESVGEMPFARLERVCSNAALLLCGAVHARPDDFRDPVYSTGPLSREGALVARRTADGFKASLADRKNTVLAWPWDHMATAVAWTATRSGELTEAAVGQALTDLGVAYAIANREQLTAVIDLWVQVTTGLNPGSPTLDMQTMGCDMLRAYEATAHAGVEP